ncbi:MAG TPA: ABC transporter substrate-binding protein, partial [Dongiaceae bacterium]
MLRSIVAAGFVGLGAMGAFMAAPHPALATQPDELVLGKSGDPDTLDPAVTVTNNSWTATYPAYERLLKFKVVDGKGSTEIEGDVAKSWSSSDDGKTWTFTLGDGHVFADGNPVNAAAVKFSFERVLKIAKGPADLFDQVASVAAPDDHTVVFTLKAPFAPFLATLVDDGASIVNPKVMDHETNGDMGQAYLSDHTMGSGPYQVASWEKS